MYKYFNFFILKIKFLLFFNFKITFEKFEILDKFKNKTNTNNVINQLNLKFLYYEALENKSYNQIYINESFTDENIHNFV